MYQLIAVAIIDIVAIAKNINSDDARDNKNFVLNNSNPQNYYVCLDSVNLYQLILIL